MDGEDMAALLIILGGVILVTGIVYSVYAYTQVLCADGMSRDIPQQMLNKWPCGWITFLMKWRLEA